MADFEVLYCPCFQEDTAVFLLLRLLIYHMHGIDGGASYIFSTNRLKNP